MTKFTILSAGVILLTTLATPVLAMSFSPPSRSGAPGNETMTRPWSAPTGHRQPAFAAAAETQPAIQQKARRSKDLLAAYFKLILKNPVSGN